MNTPNLVAQTETGGLGGDLRPSKQLPRPIHHPETGTRSGFGAER
jgi:hypothetical protein